LANLLDLHTIWQYICEFKRCLKVGGRALIHTANLATQQGWERFSKQKKYSEGRFALCFSNAYFQGGFYFMTPDIVQLLVMRCGSLKIIKSSVEDETSGNMYYLRDYIILVEKLND
jgi:hypothetical protein